jgi:hypothetical protein
VKGGNVADKAKSLAGQTLRWKFTEGPTAGVTYEHTFNRDGTVDWRDVANAPKGESRREKKADTQYASFEVAPHTHLVSYLADSGYTLSVALNLDTQRCYGIASNDKEWYPIMGKLEPVK